MIYENLPPVPKDPLEAKRWEHTRLRRRLLEGTWEQDLVDRLEIMLGTVRRQAWGIPDLSSNPFRIICREMSALYVSPPDVRHYSAGPGSEPGIGDPAEDLIKKIDDSGLWPAMQRHQERVIGCREYWIRVHVDGEGRISYRPIPPDMTLAWAHADRPGYPVEVWELRLRRALDGKATVWTYDVLDVSDPVSPSYRVHLVEANGTLGTDVTAAYLGADYSGAAYPYRRADGTPVLPYVLYHAQITGDRLFDPYENREVVEGSLNLAVHYCHLSHIIKDASWPQRYVVGAEPVGATIEGSIRGQRFEIVTDSATVLALRATDEQQPLVGQWNPGGNPVELEQVIAALANRLAQDAGVSPADIQRMGGTARSGYAIALSNEGKRDAQRRYAASFREADERLVMTTAILMNRATGSDYPESGYSVSYRAIPLSGQEMEARRRHALEMLEAGLLSRVEAIRLFDDSMSEQDAVAVLAEIDMMNGRRLEDTEQEAEESAEHEAMESPQLEAQEERAEEDQDSKVETADTGIAAAAVEAGQPASAVALNGAQVQAAQGIILAVAAGQLPRETGVQMLVQFFNIPADEADTLMGPVGASFTPPAPVATTEG